MPLGGVLICCAGRSSERRRCRRWCVRICRSFSRIFPNLFGRLSDVTRPDWPPRLAATRCDCHTDRGGVRFKRCQRPFCASFHLLFGEWPSMSRAGLPERLAGSPPDLSQLLFTEEVPSSALIIAAGQRLPPPHGPDCSVWRGQRSRKTFTHQPVPNAFFHPFSPSSNKTNKGKSFRRCSPSEGRLRKKVG